MTSFCQPVPIAKVSRPEPKLRIDPVVVEAIAAPLPLELVLGRLERQPNLIAPAKLVLSPTGEPGILAEVPRNGDIRGCETHAREAIDRALSWLSGDLEEPTETQNGGRAPEGLQDAAEALPWDREQGEDGSYNLRVIEEGVATRVRVEIVGDRSVRIATFSAVRIANPVSEEALPILALEVNRQLRLSRLSVTHIRENVAGLVWDGVLSGDADLGPALPMAVTAVVGARIETSAALRALANRRVAEAYLEVRRSRPSWPPCVTTD